MRTIVAEIKVSIILPVFNNLSYTRQCIETILSQMNYNTELIVINDSSTDETFDYLNFMGTKIKVIHNQDNLGFLKSCNKAAKDAKGKYLIFLNNDTIPQDAWIDNLVETVDQNDEVGAVGAKLLYPNGKLQEAGGIIFNDGSGRNYGKGDNPDKPEYNYTREVDYCSDACLLVRKDLFDKLGGFDERFSPAYYEDTDLCFSIRMLGYKVLYQPKSMVIHYEGASCGTDLSKGIKAYQNINKFKFVEKWKEDLIRHYPRDKKNFRLTADREKGKKILFIYPSLPEFDRYSGAFRLYNILKILIKEGHRITFIANKIKANQEKYKCKLEDTGIMVVILPEFERGKFISMRKFKKRRFFSQLLRSSFYDYDAVWFVHYDMAYMYLDLCKKYIKNAKYIVDSVDLHFLREKRHAEILSDQKMFKMAMETKKKEFYIFKKSDTVIAITKKEEDILKTESPTIKVRTIPNIHPVIENCRDFNDREHLLFIGGYKHKPNSDAVEYFYKEIFPLIKNKLKSVNFYVVGDNYPKDFVEKMSIDDVIFTGPVNDTQEYLQKCKISVAPLRFGAGMKGKIGEAMASGIPVVTTPIGAEGMGLIDGKHILIADSEAKFAERVIEIYNNQELWQIISQNGRKYIKENFSPEIIGKKINNIINSL